MNSSLPFGERLHHESERICALILMSDLPWIDIEIEINRLRQLVEDECPEKIRLFDMIYSRRFERIRRQWRP